jgi:hypothetical protein
VATASSGQVYVADGAGSGAWALEAGQDYAEIYTQDSDAISISSIGTTAQTLPFANNGPANGATANSANNRIDILDAGIYYVGFDATIGTVAAGDAGEYAFKIAVNGTNSVLETFRYMSGSNDVGSLGTFGLLALAATDQLTVRISSDDGSDTDDINLKNATLFCFLLKAT